MLRTWRDARNGKAVGKFAPHVPRDFTISRSEMISPSRKARFHHRCQTMMIPIYRDTLIYYSLHLFSVHSNNLSFCEQNNRKSANYANAYLKCVFIREKELRRDYRDNYKARRLETKMKKQKWGVAYSVFDGEELLEASVRNIRPHVDYIRVVWQCISWYGAPVHEGVRPLMMRLKEQGLVDEVLEYEVDLKLRAGKNKTRKRNMGLEAARKAGCTYFMAIDTDEFYKPEEMEYARRNTLLKIRLHIHIAPRMCMEASQHS